MHPIKSKGMFCCDSVVYRFSPSLDIVCRRCMYVLMSRVLCIGTMRENTLLTEAVCLVRQKQSTKHSPLTQLPPYKKPNSVHGRCLEPCSAAALNQTSPSMHVDQHKKPKSPSLTSTSQLSSQAGPQPCALIPACPCPHPLPR